MTLTVGPQSEVAQEISKLGHRHVVASADQCVVDEKNRIVSTPAYMIEDAALADVFKGIESLVREFKILAGV